MNLTSFFNNIKSRMSVSEGNTIHPYRDWIMVLIVVAVGLVISFVWNTHYFLTLTKQQQQAASSVQEGPDPAVTLDALEKGFQARAEEARRYQGEYLFVDPSN